MQIANYKANGELITSAGSGGGAPTDATYILQVADGDLANAQDLGSLATGLMKVTTTTGVVSSVTDSAGLAGVISDETGSGALVFGTAPTLGAPVIADFTSAQHDHGDADDGGLLPASSIGSGTLIHERGGLEADVSAYDGYIRIAGGATTNIKSTFNSAVAPTVNEDSGDGFAIGSRWLDTTADKEYVALDVTVGAAVWVETTGGGGSGITELTGDVTAGPGSGSQAATLVSGTNAALTTPKIITSINDVNGNEMLSLTATGSAVNNIALTNAATGGTPTIAAVGSDADVSIDLQPKGAGVIIAESALNMNDKQIQKALYADLKAAAAPANPSAGYIRVYADSGNSNHVTQRDSAGTVIDLAAGGGSAPDIYEDGVSVVTGATRFDFKDMNVENPSGTIGTLYHNLPGICDGRLTLTTGVPVTTSDVTAAGTLYFTPYKGNKISLYDGTRWKVYTFTERSLALTLTSGSVYDVWLYDNAGTLTLETLVWTNATTRATALASQDGVPVKSGATTRRYLGTICASGTNTTEDSLLKRFVWNYYNRVERKLKVTEATDNWSYTTTSFRSWNNSTANRVEMVVGLSEEPVYLRFDGSMYTASAVTIALGIGLDSTTTEGSDINVLMNPVNTVAPVVYTMAAYFGFPGIGYHYLQLLEYGNTGVTFYGDSGDASRSQNGALGYMRA